MFDGYEPESREPLSLPELVEWLRDELWRISSYAEYLENLAMTGADYFTDVADGKIAGEDGVDKFGANENIADGSTEVVWTPSHTVTWSASDDISHVVSSAAGDTSVVEIQGLLLNGSDWLASTQEVTLNGTTKVALNPPLIRAFRMEMLGAANVGTIQCGVGGTGSTFLATELRAQIDAGVSKTLQAIYTIPSGRKGLMHQYYGSIKRNSVRNPDSVVFRVMARKPGAAFHVEHVIGAAIAGTSYIPHQFRMPKVFGEKTDIYIDATPDGAAADVAAGFDMVLRTI